ncbi:MAG: riboflavin synthase [Gemmatimonadaceae bacterium]
MFTGLVDDVGTIEQVASTDVGRMVRVRCRYDDLRDGESVAVNGVCLTVREHEAGWFTAAAMTTTLGATTMADWGGGLRVNLERAMRPTDRLGGHFVQGHVDGVARVVRAETVEDALLLELALPPSLSELMVERGSVAVNGVSLTVSALPAPDIIQVSLIEYTWRHTTLGDLRVGDSVNIEADVIAKHVRHMLAAHRNT